MMHDGRVANVALLREVGPLPISGERSDDTRAAAAATVAMVNADQRGPYRMWVARGRAIFVRPEPAARTALGAGLIGGGVQR